MADIDTLQIKINAEATKANDAIERLIGKLDSLSNSLVKLDGSRLGVLANGIQRFGTAMQTMNNIKTSDFTRLAKNISALNNLDVSNLSNVASSVNHIGTSIKNLSGLSEGAKQLSELSSGIRQLGYKSAGKAIENIPKLATAMKQLMNELSTVPKVSQNLIDMTNALAKLARTGASSGRAADSIIKSFNGISKSSRTASVNVSKLGTSFNGLFRQILPYVGIWELLSFGKEAVEISSDLTEVQNVVDVTFGDMASKIEALSETSITDFGMSELTLKKVSSRFQAMGIAMGFTQEKMSDMSIELTKLTADLASFYNEDQTDVASRLQSVFTGETEPMRRYGIDLTQATLKEYAMKKGLDANIESMTLAEKTMLRYNYVIENTAVAHGDFARTSGTWANQVRILSQYFQALKAIIGEVIINAVKPFVQAMNAAMSSILAFARNVANALGAIFGWTIETGGGVANDLEDAATAAGETADGMGAAADNAKKLQDYTLGFDELHVINPNEDAGGAGGVGGAGVGESDLGTIDSELKRTDGLLDKYKSEIKTLEELGQYVGDSLKNTLDGIDWDSVYEKASNFGTGLAQFLNGLISPELFESLGTTIANSLNTVLYGLNSFAREFDWTNFGLSLAAGINGFFRNFKFSLAADTINRFALGILESLNTAIENTEWDTIGQKIGEFLKGIQWLEILSEVGNLIWNAIKASITLYANTFSAAPIETAILTGLSVLKFTDIGKKIAIKISTSISTALGSAPIKNTISAGLKALFGGEAAKSALVFMFPQAASILSTATTWVSSTLLPTLTTALTGIGTRLAAIISGPWGIAIAAALTGLFLIITNWDTVVNFFTETLPNWWNNTVIPFFESIPDKIGEIWENVKTWTVGKWEEIIAWIGEVPDKIAYALGFLVGKLILWMQNIWNTLSTEIPKIITNVVNFFVELPDKISTAIQTFVTTTLPTWYSNITSWVTTEIPKIITNVVTFFSELPGKIFTAIQTFVTTTLPTWYTNVTSWISTEIPEIIQSIADWFLDLPDKIMEVIKNVYETIKGIGSYILDGIIEGLGSVKDKLGEWKDLFIQGLKDAMDIHSPSTIARDEVGIYVGQGIIKGIPLGFNDIGNITKQLIEEIKESMETMLQSVTNSISGLNSQLDRLIEKMSQLKSMDTGVGAGISDLLNGDMQNNDTELNNLGSSAGNGMEIGSSMIFGDSLITSMEQYAMFNEQLLEMQQQFAESFQKGWDVFSETFKENYTRFWTDMFDFTYKIADNMRKSFQHVSDEVIKMLNQMIRAANSVSSLTGKRYSHVKGYTSVQGEKFAIPKFQAGGFPDENGLFMANSTELVGRFTNGKTAVANNDQIIQGIKQGVYEAMMSVMSQQEQQPIEVNVRTELDGEVVYRNQQRVAAKRGYNFNMGAFQR